MKLKQKLGNNFKQSIKVQDRLFKTKSDYQKIEIYESDELGNILVIDNEIAMTQKDAPSYYEMIAQVPVCTHREPQKVLILGGGLGGSAREILRHEDISIDVVELDEEIVNVSKKYFGTLSSSLENDNVKLTISNGMDFISDSEDKSYDIIIVDVFSHNSQYKELFEPTFYAQANRVLKDNGLLVTQGGSYREDIQNHKELLTNAGSNFWIAMPYNYEFMGRINNFILASKKYHPTADIILQRADLIDDLHYYNSDIQRSSFIMPTYINKALLGIAKR
jgi:spermidine synthase